MAPDLPVAGDATEVEYDAAAETLTYMSSTTVSDLVDYYRSELPVRGWQEDETAPLVSEQLASLDFTKGEASLSISLLQVGAATSVTLTGSGLSSSGGVAASTPTADGDATADQGLTAEDKDGLPVPSDYTEYTGEQGPFRSGLTAVSPSALKAVLALYRAELTARRWAELPATVAPTDQKAALLFQDPQQGQLALNLSRNSAGGTHISLVIRDEAGARAAGALPPPGKARVYFANPGDAEVTFTIAGQEIKAPVDSPDATMADAKYIDVSPGKLAFTLMQPGAGASQDELQLAAGDVWALVAGPGGVLPLQLY